ncbi:9491_t:CDS:2 [Ambispora leptoticha]|uniref:9491_t:CDS:1 n=1 Tax=Ambispora leptoticha TaxID=144679 RepID=A0A9N9CI11_9GLOM|nr:9491_t:CDS:2 [Ambispora leptoticha]
MYKAIETDIKILQYDINQQNQEQAESSTRASRSIKLQLFDWSDDNDIEDKNEMNDTKQLMQDYDILEEAEIDEHFEETNNGQLAISLLSYNLTQTDADISIQ